MRVERLIAAVKGAAVIVGEARGEGALPGAGRAADPEDAALRSGLHLLIHL